MPLSYSSLYLSWVKPVSPDCVTLRLVRTGLNLSQNPGADPGTTTNADAGSDGYVLFTDTVDRLPNFIDVGLGGGFFYYTMWGWSNQDQIWIRCSDVIGLVPLNWNYGWRLYMLLPEAYRDRDWVLVDHYNPLALPRQNDFRPYEVESGDSWQTLASHYGTTPESLAYINGEVISTPLTLGQSILVPWPNSPNPDPPLRRFLGLIGFQFDFIRTELESLMSVNDAMHCSGALLPLMAQQYALVHEPEIGMQQERTLVQNAVHLFKLKGTPRGITDWCSIMTSYPFSRLVHHGYNCLLCLDDSAFTDGIGTWQSWPPRGASFEEEKERTWFDPDWFCNQTFGYYFGSGGVNVEVTGFKLTWIPDLPMAGTSSPLGDMYPDGFPVWSPEYLNSGMSLSADGPGTLDTCTAGIPITDFVSETYGPGNATFRVGVWSPTARQVNLSIWADEGSDEPILIAEQNFTSVAGHWSLFTLTTPIDVYPDLDGPAQYYWLYPRIRIINAAAHEVHYVTLAALWPTTPNLVGLNTPEFDYARDLKVNLEPVASNLLGNTLTSFDRLNPDDGRLRIGFDGLCAVADPITKAGPQTGQMVYRRQTVDDAPSSLTVNGNAALQFNVTAPGGTVWFGRIPSWSPEPPTPDGWWDPKTSDWYPGAGPGASAARPWMSDTLGWFAMPFPPGVSL